MPAWQAAETLARSVASVQAQTYENWELMIIDDHATDATAEIARTLARQDHRITVLTMARNSGAALARNRGIETARGRYIAFLDADDVWMSDKLTRQIAFMQETGAQLSYTGFWRRSGTREHEITVPPTLTHAELLRGNQIGCLTAMYDTAQLGKAFMSNMRMRQDFALWLHILKKIPKAHGLQQPLAVHCRQDKSLSSNIFKGLHATWQVYRKHEHLGPIQSLWCLSNHVLNRTRARL